MPLIIDETDQSQSIAITLQKALSNNAKETLLDGLISGNMNEKDKLRLNQVIDDKKKLLFQLCVKDGKVSRPRYEVIIDFNTNEVSVLHLQAKQTLNFSKFIVQEGGTIEKSDDSVTS